MAHGQARNEDLLPSHNISRQCRGGDLDDDGIPLEGAFRLRDNEHYLSTNWLEYFSQPDRKSQIRSVVCSLRNKGRTVRSSTVLAVLNVGSVVSECKHQLGLDLRIATLGEPDDPSHTGIFGYVENNDEVALLLASLVDPAEVFRAGAVL